MKCLFMELKDKLITIVRNAGNLLLKHYENTTIKNRAKPDLSPVTEADLESHLFLCDSIGSISSFPILSEEKEVPYARRKNWKEFWLIDPLDGTKEFIAHNDEFCINIALIKDSKPIAGIIFAPALDELYYAEEGKGLYIEIQGRVLDILPESSSDLRVARSRSHLSPKTKEFIESNGPLTDVPLGSALKFAHLILGKVNLYPRFEGSKEWDIAAGHALLKEAGHKIIDLQTGKEPLYNKLIMENNPFVAWHSSALPQEILERFHLS